MLSQPSDFRGDATTTCGGNDARDHPLTLAQRLVPHTRRSDNYAPNISPISRDEIGSFTNVNVP